MSAKVSVIVPVCNVEKYLKECLTSVMNQSLEDIQIICVNDGSTDVSLRILSEFSRIDNRITVIDKNNSGYGDSVNRAIEVSTGEYIGIVESDDFIDDKMFEQLYALTKNGTVDIVKGNFYDYYDYDNHKVYFEVNQERKNVPENKIFTVRKNPEILWGHPSIWSGIYRREFINENHIRFMKAAGGGWVDNPFFFETLFAAKSIIWTNQPYYYYRKTNPNSSSNKQVDLTLPLRRMLDNLDVTEKYSFVDEESLKYLYARALMYLTGVFAEKDYYKQIDLIRPYAKKLLSRLNENVLLDNFNDSDLFTFYKNISPLSDLIKPIGKILIYNWIPFDNPNGIGGGVNVYCRNLVSEILKSRPDVQVYFLSSGWAYDISTTETYIRKIDNIFGERCRSFEIVNSPVPAAQNLLLNNPTVSFQNEKLKNIFESFLKDYGSFSVVHFNNIEGLSLDCLCIKNDFPNTRFIYSMHNYIPFCVTGFYYHRTKQCICTPQHDKKDCFACTSVGRNKDISKELILRAKYSQTKSYDENQWVQKMGFSRLDELAEPKTLLDFCEKAKNAINLMDKILAVSERVRELAVENGILAEKVTVSYIGTKIAEYQIHESINKGNDIFTIGYLGANVSFQEKGYPFLLSALSSLPENEKQTMKLILTKTSGSDKEIKEKLRGFKSVKIINGYSHSELKNILKDADIGIVPVLWEDNLPQIAIEMNAIGVPVLASDAGGASELCSDDRFIFKHGDTQDFLNHLLYIKNNRSVLQEYWNKSKTLITMHEHLCELEKYYGFPEGKSANISLDDYRILLSENAFLQNLLRKKDSEIYCLRDSRRKSFVIKKIARGKNLLLKTATYLSTYGMKKTIKKIGNKILK